ncbi:MAG TPA: SNF2-related protein, partial [Gaiellales bacterium]|nr:SNF2-related protein [Gaiellales bacterium]
MSRRAPLELVLLPRSGDEPMMGFYSVTPLTPGGWADLLDRTGLPHDLRRGSETVELGGRRRSVDLRCLSMLPALAYLLAPAGDGESGSVWAWRLVAQVVERAVRAGSTVPDLSRLTAAFPGSAHALVTAAEELDPDGDRWSVVTAADAVAAFVEGSRRALARAVREPVLLTQPDAHARLIDLSVLQPSLRAVAPDLGAVAPVISLRDSLAPLTLVLGMPEPDGERWPLAVEPDDPGTVRRAARMFPPLVRARGGTVALTIDEVLELRLAAGALEFAGARVRLPAELEEDGDLEIADAVMSLPSGPLSLSATVHYDLRASLGGREISPEEFRQLAVATQPLVRLGGTWRTLSPRALRRARGLAAVVLHGSTVPALTALGAALAGAAEVRGIEVGVEVERGTGLDELVATLRDPGLRAPVDPPAGFSGELRPYQRVGLGWLVRMRRLGLGALLADDMGLGKTVQLIAYLLDRSGASGPALIICPTSVLGNWERELHRFAPELRTLVHHGPERARRLEELRAADVVLTSYALLPRDRELLCEEPWRVLVLDEAQVVKNPLTRAAQAARAVAAGHRIALTGTPIENRLDELWSIMHVLNPGLLGTRTSFRRLVSAPIERRSDERAEERLRQVTDPFLLRRRKSDPLVLPDLPPRQDSTEYCTLTLEQASLYQATIDTVMRDVRGAAGIERRGHVLALITRLKQVCNHPVHALGRPGVLVGRSGKLDRLTEMLTEALAEGDNALVFTQYAVMGELLVGHVERQLGIERLYIDGSTRRLERERIVDRFQREGGEPRVLVMSLRAGGLGLNLTAA